jgi:hypothetical protein
MTISFHAIDGGTVMPDIPLIDGILALKPASFYDAISHYSLMYWCHHHARYGLPTIELVEWLQERIGNREAIEIGSGCGDLAYHLDIVATDNRVQEWKQVKEHYRILGQPLIKYGNHVNVCSANHAVLTYKPEVVIGSWITEWIDPDLPPPSHGGSIYGVKEDKIVKQCEYILIGNIAIHGKKKIMQLPHEEYNLPFVRSRAHYPELNRVWIWKLS